MSRMAFSVVGARAERYAAAPQIALRVRVTESSGVPIYAIALQAQIQLEPQRRRYGQGESAGLVELFGEPERYGSTLRPLQWAQVSKTVLAFTGETEFDLAIPCSYDFEVAAHKYLSALREGEIPLLLLFSGTVFERGAGGISAGLVPWSCEARYRLPVAVWRETMDAFFPNSAWIRIDRDVFDELHRFKTARGFPTLDAALARLCEEAGVRR